MATPHFPSRRLTLPAALLAAGLAALPASAELVEGAAPASEEIGPEGLTDTAAILAHGVADSLYETPYRIGQEDVVIALEPGENLSIMLERAGVDRNDRHHAAEALEEFMDLRRLRPEHSFRLTLQHTGASTRLMALETMPDVDTIVLLDRDPEGQTFSAEARPNELEVRTTAARGEIVHSLFADAAAAGVPDRVIMGAIPILSYTVDFQRDIKPGDRFALMFAQEFFADGELARDGAVLYASLGLPDREIELYRYEDSQGGVDYYNRDGESTRRVLMRTPIDGARLSSGFGMRRHPILGYGRMHRGTDFAAPTGTPIYAAGDGVIEFIGNNAGYGRYIRIRHNNQLSTAYAHMSRFASGLSRGDRVQQGETIGYVGSTGMSTGPHLHYEVLVDGSQVNPMSVDLPTGINLEGAELAAFQAQVAEIDREFAQLEQPSSRTRATAQASGR